MEVAPEEPAQHCRSQAAELGGTGEDAKGWMETKQGVVRPHGPPAPRSVGSELLPSAEGPSFLFFGFFWLDSIHIKASPPWPAVTWQKQRGLGINWEPSLL